jgi:hypothetical protein
MAAAARRRQQTTDTHRARVRAFRELLEAVGRVEEAQLVHGTVERTPRRAHSVRRRVGVGERAPRACEPRVVHLADEVDSRVVHGGGEVGALLQCEDEFAVVKGDADVEDLTV